MNILLVGYGFYVLGNDNCDGGTILPSICRWALLNPFEIIQISLLVRNVKSKKRCVVRLEKFFKKSKIDIKNLSVKLITYDNLVGEEKHDAAIIAIPESHHLDCIEKISDHVQKIICVKPVGKNYEEYLKIVDVQDKKGLEIFIDFHKRFDESNMHFIDRVRKISADKSWFTFFYGQKEEIPRHFFKKWVKTSNPFQYLAPHYLDVIFQASTVGEDIFEITRVEGEVNSLVFDSQSKVVDLVNASIMIFGHNKEILVNACCNWCEPKKFPHTSRQRIEFQTRGHHIISEQDYRGQSFSDDKEYFEPNPHFMASDPCLFSSGYGITSYENFFRYVKGVFPRSRLASLAEFEPVSKVIDFVNSKIG